jgi:hypothetical protein
MIAAHVIAEPTWCSANGGHNAGSCEDCAPQTCDLCGNHVGAEAHAWMSGWVCPDCCPRCGFIDKLRSFDMRSTDNLADVIADGALTDDEVASVMGVD